MPTFESRTRALLDELQSAGLKKPFREITSPMGPTVEVQGIGRIVVLCANNYLGLANHPSVVAAGHAALDRYGAGTASVRFICGTFDAHRRLEAHLAAFSGSPAALTYVSCWNANQALLATVPGPQDVVLSDALNHASIIDGCRLAKPRDRLVYAHGDMDDLEAKLKTVQDAEARWVVTDGVFSMEGDVAPLPRLVELCHAYRALLVVDDSHGVGVLGRTGRGTAEHFGLHGRVDILTGTLGKSLGGAAGGYVAGARDLVDLLEQRSRPALFSNALSPVTACCADKALELVERDTTLIDRLRSNIGRIRNGLNGLGFRCAESPSAIIPIHIGDEAEALRMSRRLLELGVWVVAFGFPVVPKGKARLRVQVSAALEEEHLAVILEAFRKL